jgi:hypothetical protein
VEVHFAVHDYFPALISEHSILDPTAVSLLPSGSRRYCIQKLIYRCQHMPQIALLQFDDAVKWRKPAFCQARILSSL